MKTALRSMARCRMSVQGTAHQRIESQMIVVTMPALPKIESRRIALPKLALVTRKAKQ
ncbi:MAG: hypothetical protein WA197_12005 [Candidatus Acidiferrales bacterium]